MVGHRLHMYFQDLLGRTRSLLRATLLKLKLFTQYYKTIKNIIIITIITKKIINILQLSIFDCFIKFGIYCSDFMCFFMLFKFI